MQILSTSHNLDRFIDECKWTRCFSALLESVADRQCVVATLAVEGSEAPTDTEGSAPTLADQPMTDLETSVMSALRQVDAACLPACYLDIWRSQVVQRVCVAELHRAKPTQLLKVSEMVH